VKIGSGFREVHGFSFLRAGPAIDSATRHRRPRYMISATSEARISGLDIPAGNAVSESYNPSGFIIPGN